MSAPTDLLPVTVDLLHLDRPNAIASHLMGDVVVDPGAEKTIDQVLDALGDATPRAILLTHIHFDHAGGTGALVERFSDVEVWVHELGAPHLVDPTRLVASATKIYGDYFAQLWGKVIPVPERNLRVLAGGETVGDWEVAYTPGHAKHHVSYLHSPTRTAFTGDVTGVRMHGGPPMPPTPPPDIDPVLWHASIDTIAAWEPRRLAFSHFGQVTDVADHLAGLHASLDAFTETSQTTDAMEMAAWIRGWITEQAGEDAVADYWASSPFEGMWSGFDRYWKTQAVSS